VCDQCGRLIGVGETYRRRVYKDGDICTYKAHVDCDDAAQEMFDRANLYSNEYMCLQNYIDVSDSGWLWSEFPDVAERLQLSSPSWFEIWRRGYGW